MMSWQRTARCAASVLMVVTLSAHATEWVADFTSAAPEDWASSDSSALAYYADTQNGQPNYYTVTYDDAGAVPSGWLTQGARAGTPTTAKFYNAPGGGSGRARFATPLPTTMDANGGISFSWRARYGDYSMGRAPVQTAFFDTGTSAGTPYNAYFRVQNGSELTILENGGAAYGNIGTLSIPNVADGFYHQWSCAVVTSGGLAHWKLWLDGNLLLFTGADGAHTFDPGGGAQQFSFSTASDGFTPMVGGASGAYLGLGELNDIDQWDFEFDCVSFKDDGLAELTCGSTPACESVVTPVDSQTSVAEQNGSATPAGIDYTFLNTGTGPVSYTVAETDASGTPLGYGWLSLSTSLGGPVAPGASEVVTANIIDTSMAPGTYTAYVTVTDTCAASVQHIRRIDLTITPPGVTRIDPNDDLTLRGTANHNADPPFGLFVKNASDVSYVEFTLGTTPATEATLVLYQADPGITNPWEVVIRGEEFDFDETTFTGTDTTGWARVGTIPGIETIAFYEMDLTTWYNSNLGKTMTLFFTRDVQPSGDGVIFEDREGTKTSEPLTYGPRLEVLEGTVPSCQSIVNPGGRSTAIAFRNQTPTPASFQFEVVNAGANPLSYTATELEAVVSSTSDLYSTGVDNGRNALGAHALDPHWTIIEGGLDGTCTAGTPCAAYTVIQDGFPIPPWVPNTSTSMWITPSPTDDDALAPVGDHVYRTTFTVSDPNSTAIRMRVSADDNLQSVLLNNVETDPAVIVATGTFSEWHEFVITSGFQVGLNTLDFRVGNGGESDNPSGLHVDFDFFDLQAGDVTWLVLNPTVGGPILSGNSDVITASIVDTDLPDGIHTAFVGITDNCTPAVTHVREIELTVIDCLSQVTPAGDTGRSFRIGSGQTPAPVSYTFENTAVALVSYTVSTTGDCSWLQLDKTDGDPIGPGASDTVTGTIDPTGLSAGGHVCTLTFTDNCNPAVQHDRNILLSVDESVSGPPSGLQQFDAEFSTFTGTDLASASPLESCDPGASTDREFSIGYNQVGALPAGWLTQGSIDGTPTTVRFDNPPDGNGGRVRFRTFLPFDDTFDPEKGMIVAWSMRVGSGDTIVRGPIQITFPRVTGPFNTDNSVSSIPGDVFNVYIRVQNGTDIRILNNGGGAIGTIDQITLPNSIADAYHQWTASVCYNAADAMAYWNLWLDGEKLMFGGANGSVIGPGGDVFSFRTGLENVTGDPYIGLGELNAGEDTWDFEFDWVRMVTLNVTGCPFWNGAGCILRAECATPFADSDQDGDVDQDDFADFQLCFTMANDPQGEFDIAQCACFDRDEDSDIDTLDFERFEACASGPDVPWQPSPACPEGS